MGLMKVCYENPHGLFLAFCVLFFICIAVISFILVIGDSMGFNFGHKDLWTNIFIATTTGISTFLLGGNIMKKIQK